jgi:hypothetical protein
VYFVTIRLSVNDILFNSTLPKTSGGACWQGENVHPARRKGVCAKKG